MIQVMIFFSLMSYSVRAETAPGLPDDLTSVRDPFKKPLIIKEKVEPKTDLEQYASDQYKMVGVITGLDHLRAIVVDPSGKTHFVGEQMRIGLRRGIVKKIMPNSIKVREKMINVVGQEENIDIEIRLPAENTSATAADLNASEVVQQPMSPVGQVGTTNLLQISPPPPQAQSQNPSTTQAPGQPAPDAPAFLSPILRKNMEGGSK